MLKCADVYAFLCDETSQSVAVDEASSALLDTCQSALLSLID